MCGPEMWCAVFICCIQLITLLVRLLWKTFVIDGLCFSCLLLVLMSFIEWMIRLLLKLLYSLDIKQSTRLPIQINQPTRCNNFSSLLLDVYLQLNMFRASSRPSSGAQQLQKQPLVLPLERGDSSAVGRGRASQPAGPTATNSTAITMLQR